MHQGSASQHGRANKVKISGRSQNFATIIEEPEEAEIVEEEDLLDIVADAIKASWTSN